MPLCSILLSRHVPIPISFLAFLVCTYVFLHSVVACSRYIFFPSRFRLGYGMDVGRIARMYVFVYRVGGLWLSRLVWERASEMARYGSNGDSTEGWSRPGRFTWLGPGSGYVTAPFVFFSCLLLEYIPCTYTYLFLSITSVKLMEWVWIIGEWCASFTVQVTELLIVWVWRCCRENTTDKLYYWLQLSDVLLLCRDENALP